MLKKSTLYTLTILFCVFLGAALGLLGGKEIRFFSVSLYPTIDLIATIFLNTLLLLVIPLIFSSIVSGMIKMQKEHSFSNLGVKTLITFVTTNFIAILTGALFFFLFKHYVSIDYAELSSSGITNIAKGDSIATTSLIKNLIPSSISDLLSGKYIIALILIALFLGYAVTKLSSKEKNFLSELFESLFQASLYLTQMLMKILPIGVLALVAKQLSQTGPKALQLLSYFILMMFFGLLFYILVPLSVLVRYVALKSPLKHLQHMFPAIVTAFSTSSSAATLPVTMECLEEKAGIPNTITSLVVPLGTALNMSGSALFVVGASMFLGTIYGVTFSLTTIITTILLSLIATIGIAGIPSAALVSVIIVIQGLQLPGEAIGILFAVDRILDMLRTPTNAYTASCSALIINKIQSK